jgi:hypothetical protein
MICRCVTRVHGPAAGGRPLVDVPAEAARGASRAARFAAPLCMPQAQPIALWRPIFLNTNVRMPQGSKKKGHEVKPLEFIWAKVRAALRARNREGVRGYGLLIAFVWAKLPAFSAANTARPFPCSCPPAFCGLRSAVCRLPPCPCDPPAAARPRPQFRGHAPPPTELDTCHAPPPTELDTRHAPPPTELGVPGLTRVAQVHIDDLSRNFAMNPQVRAWGRLSHTRAHPSHCCCTPRRITP